jgi:hypothetical protein
MRTYEAMRDGKWLTLGEIAQIIGAPMQSVSARIRDLRKERFGGHVIERRRFGYGGTFEYRLKD